MIKTTQTWKIGDCLQLLPEIPDKSIDMILTDLPYGTTACKWDTIIPLNILWTHYNRILNVDGVIVLTAAQPFTSKLISSNIHSFKYCWYWKKRPVNFLNAKHQPLRNIEEIVVFYRGKYNPQGLTPYHKLNKRSNSTASVGIHGLQNISEYTNYPNQVLEITNGERGIHPTQKPVALFEYLIKTYTNEGDTVHDSCLGSGTTLEACKKTNRNCIGFELSNEWEKYYYSRLGLEI